MDRVPSPPPIGRHGAASFAAIDVETATSRGNSICAIGVVVVEHGDVSLRQHWLVQPPDNVYARRNIEIHGIDPGMTESAPDFARVWREVHYLVGDRPLVAHNASFDVSMLRGTGQWAGVRLPDNECHCTVKMARRVWRDLPRHTLPVVASSLGISLNHHDALSDAEACARIALACIDETGAAGLRDAADRLGLRPSPLTDAVAAAG